MLRHNRVWRYVDEVARSGSVRQASERLNVTPSAVLRRIQDVEQDLGQALFERTGSGMLLTTAGELFVDWIRRQNADLEMVRSQIEDVAGVRRGHIRLVCSQAAAASLVPRQIASFQTQHPDVQFTVQTASHEEAVRRLVQYEVDLALIFGPPLRPEIQAYASVGQRLVAVMRRDHPLSSKPWLRLHHCLAYPLALLDRSFSGRRLIDAALAGISAARSVAIESNSFEALGTYVAHSNAITFQVDVGTLGVSAGSGGLCVRPLHDDERAYAPLVLLHLKGRSLSVATRRFADAVAAELHELRMQPLSPEIGEVSR